MTGVAPDAMSLVHLVGGWLAALAQACVVLAAGVCVVRRLVAGASLAEIAIQGVGISLTIVPTAAFCAAWLLGLPLAAPVVVGICLALVLACRPWSLPAIGRAGRAETVSLALLAAAAIVLLAVTDFHPPEGGFFFDLCLHRAALFLHEFARGAGSGWTIRQQDLGDITYVLPRQDGPVFGFYSVMAAQRPADGAVVATFFALSDGAGPALVSVLFFFAIAGGGFLVASRFVGSGPIRVAVGIATLAGVHGLSAYMVNETVFAMTAGLLLLAWLLRPGLAPAAGALAGALFGFAVGGRVAAASWVAAVAVLLAGRGRTTKVALATGFAVSVAPWLAVNWFLRGNPFYYPNTDDALVQHQVMGLSFAFRPLNWPLHETLVRVPGHVLPPLLLLPVLAIRSLGSVLAGIAATGLAVVAFRERRLAVGLVLWALPVAVFLHLLAYLDGEKASWLLLAAPVLPVGLASFVRGLATGWRRRAAAVASLAVGLAFVPRLLAGIDVPEDPRPYRIIEPNTPERDIHVRYGDAWRSELSKPAILPGLNDVPPGYRLLATLLSVRPERSFESGRVALMLENLDGPVSAEFSMDASRDPPPLLPPDIEASRTVPPREPTRARFVLLEVMASPRPRVAVDGWIVENRRSDEAPRDFLRIDIDPGPEPHERMYLGLIILRPWDLDTAPEPTEIRVGGVPVALRGVGYEFESDAGQTRFYPSVLTNLAVPEQPAVSGETREDGETWRYRWTVRDSPGPGGGRTAPAAPGAASLDLAGPFVY
jgi:hypothetical protein